MSKDDHLGCCNWRAKITAQGPLEGGDERCLKKDKIASGSDNDHLIMEGAVMIEQELQLLGDRL